jgi:DNA invertase Pin-like site-specific DNA recombinase
MANKVETIVKTVALYARVSTVNGHQDPEMQLRELRQHCTFHNLTITSEYVDRGISGSKESRPQLNLLMAAAKEKQFDALLCWKIDRFGRSLKHLVNALADLEKWGVAFISLKDNIDLSTSTGRLMFGIIAVMAQFERELIRERVCAGLRNAQAKGRVLGNRKRTYIDVSEIRRLRAEGMSWRDISRAVGVPRSTCQWFAECPTDTTKTTAT